MCHLLAEVADAAARAIPQVGGAASEALVGMFLNVWGDREGLAEARAVVSALVAQAIGVAAGLQAVRLAASIGAVTFCPNVAAHEAVRNCGNPLVEEVRDATVEKVAAALREAPPDLPV